MTLDQLHVGERAVITHVAGAGALRHRLAEMGLIPGKVILVSHVAPLGDPTAYLIMGYQLSLRRREAARIHVTKDAGGVASPR